jgi:hypothetical protein
MLVRLPLDALAQLLAHALQRLRHGVRLHAEGGRDLLDRRAAPVAQVAHLARAPVHALEAVIEKGAASDSGAGDRPRTRRMLATSFRAITSAHGRNGREAS